MKLLIIHCILNNEGDSGEDWLSKNFIVSKWIVDCSPVTEFSHCVCREVCEADLVNNVHPSVEVRLGWLWVVELSDYWIVSQYCVCVIKVTAIYQHNSDSLMNILIPLLKKFGNFRKLSKGFATFDNFWHEFLFLFTQIWHLLIEISFIFETFIKIR